jgi:ferritin-like metal-binding protein YciE
MGDLFPEQAMTANDMRTVFLVNLATMYDGELQLLDLMPRLVKETAPGEASRAFADHLSETARHAENLRRCFQLLDEEAFCVVNHAIRGLGQDHGAFVATEPSHAMLVAFDLAVAEKTEHFEIGAYIGLLQEARLLGVSDVALLLAENLRQERAAAARLERLADELALSTAEARVRMTPAPDSLYGGDDAVPATVVRDGMTGDGDDGERNRFGTTARRQAPIDADGDDIPDRGGAT